MSAHSLKLLQLINRGVGVVPRLTLSPDEVTDVLVLVPVAPQALQSGASGLGGRKLARFSGEGIPPGRGEANDVVQIDEHVPPDQALAMRVRHAVLLGRAQRQPFVRQIVSSQGGHASTRG
jgi:hypothetical protein